MNISLKYFFQVCVILCFSCKSNDSSTLGIGENVAVTEMYKEYIDAWELKDSAKIVNMFTDDAMLMPNNICPIVGKESIIKFWYPNNGSTMTIHDFSSDKLLSTTIYDTIATTTHNSTMDWTYVKDSFNVNRVQKTITTTVFKLQKDKNWKIWRQMWCDFHYDNK